MNYLNIARSRYPEELIADTSSADCIVVNSFGTETGTGSVNQALALYATRIANSRPIIADTMVAHLMSNIAMEVTGDVSSGAGRGVGTWGIEVVAQEFMAEHNLQIALQIAQKWHMGRVCMQAEKAGIMHNIVPLPEDMPSHFDAKPGQVWTRNRGLWVLREIIGAPVLHAQDKL